MNKDLASNTAQRSNMCVKCSQKYFAVRFFIESIAYLKEKITVELFYLQARYSIFKVQLRYFELTAKLTFIFCFVLFLE